jgi:hypothetical protein
MVNFTFFILKMPSKIISFFLHAPIKLSCEVSAEETPSREGGLHVPPDSAPITSDPASHR